MRRCQACMGPVGPLRVIWSVSQDAGFKNLGSYVIVAHGFSGQYSIERLVSFNLRTTFS